MKAPGRLHSHTIDSYCIENDRDQGVAPCAPISCTRQDTNPFPRGIKMRLVAAVLVFAAVSSSASAQASSKSYWLLSRDSGHTWCGYSDMTDFKSEADKLKPTESAIVTYSSGKLTELTYQVEPESGDWIVVDKYTPSDNKVFLRRANLLTQENLQVIQSAVIRDGNAEPLRVVSVTTLEGKKTKASNVDFPNVPVRTTLARISFMAVVAEMRSQSISKVCRKLE